MRSMTAVLLLLCALPVSAADNLIPNGDFSAELDGWSPNRPKTEPVVDTEVFHSPPAALRLPSVAEKVGMQTQTFELPRPLSNALTVSGWVRADAVDEDASIGFDLRILLDDGTETWFFPNSLQVQPDDVGEWVHKTATYVAPAGLKVAATAAYCLNYRSDGATAWFDDVTLKALDLAEPEHDVVVLFRGEPDTGAAGEVSAALDDAGIEHDRLPAAADVSAAKLVILPEWIEDESLYFRLKVFHYLGGRVIVTDLPDAYYARGLAQYFWNAPPDSLAAPLALSEDGRAAHITRIDAVDLDDLTASLLSTELDLPDEIPAIDCGPKPPIELRDGALYVGDGPLLWRAMGTYRVDGSRTIAQHAANFAHYAREIHLNGLIIYLGYQTDPEHLRTVLDAAWEEGLHAVVWIRGPAVRGYSEKPVKDEWLLRFLPLRSHPAFLGWEMADDTWGRHLRYLERTSEVIRRYDRQNLVTTTVMDLRTPERLPEERWQAYRRIIDYPLTYLYPLQKGATFGGNVDIEGGFEDVQRLAEHTRGVWGENVYIQQWCQAHMQGFAYPRTGIPARSTYMPSAEQQRLLTCTMLTSGTRGIAYFSTYGLADHRLGMGRRAELGLLWGELKPVEDILAGGEIVACETSDPSVEAKAFTRDGETVVLAVKHGEQYNRYVHDAVVEDLSITLPFDAPQGSSCLSLNGPKPGPVALDDRTIRLAELDLSSAVLITADEGRVSSLRAGREQWAPLCARLAMTAMADTAAKLTTVADHIGPLADNTFRELVEAGGAEFNAAMTAYPDNPEAAWRASRLALRHWREARAYAIQQAEAEYERLGLEEEVLPLLNIYPALPNFAHRYLAADEPDYRAMHDEIISSLEKLDFLVREPTVEAEG